MIRAAASYDSGTNGEVALKAPPTRAVKLSASSVEGAGC